MRCANFLSHAERARRRAQIKRELRDGHPPRVIAQRHELTTDYIGQIARAIGIHSSRGRPAGARAWRECPPDLAADYDFLVRRKRLPVATVRSILEGVPN